jgi:phytoene dehydrogenase-like protein
MARSTDAVCVIGAGPAGLSAAHYLRERGYQRVTVLEAANRVGGKCCTIAHEGEAYDLGAVLAAPGYTHVLELARRHDVEAVPGPPHVLVDRERAWSRPLGPLVLDFTSPATYRAVLSFARALAQNRGLARPGFAALGPDAHLTGREYIDRHGLQPLEDSLYAMFSGYGYGFPAEVPVAYLFKLLYLLFPDGPLSAARWLKLRADQEGPIAAARFFQPLMFRGGYQGLFEKVAAPLDVELGAEVRRVERKGGRVEVTVGERTQTFDRVIVTMDARRILETITLTAEETSRLAQVRFVPYYSFLCRLSGAPALTASFHIDRVRKGLRNRVLVVSQPNGHPSMSVIYVIGAEDGTLRSIEGGLAEDLASLGHRLDAIVARGQWTYFPHLAPAAMRSFYADIDRAQGTGGLYFAGELLSFATVESVCRYSRSLVNRFFA